MHCFKQKLKKIIFCGFFASLSSTFILQTLYAKAQYTEVNYYSLPGWSKGDQSESLEALKHSCEKILTTSSKKLSYSNRLAWQKACKEITKLPDNLGDDKARSFLNETFIPYQITYQGENEGLFTGYFEPAYQGSRTQTAYYKIPIYKRPDNLIMRKTKSGKYQYGRMVNGKFERYYSREDIAKHNYFTKKDVIAWVHDRVDRVFLQIQGSGRIVFPDGSDILVSYNGQNGWPYKPIGRLLLQWGVISREDMSMQNIKKWLKANPNRVDEVLNYDPSFVFFKVKKEDTLVGAEGTPLTPGYSMAVDWRYTPYGTPIWLDSHYPTPSGNKPLNRLLIAQDTGGAIRGPIRGDVFWGNSDQAEYTAGHMKSSGRIWVLLPKGYDI